MEELITHFYTIIAGADYSEFTKNVIDIEPYSVKAEKIKDVIRRYEIKKKKEKYILVFRNGVVFDKFGNFKGTRYRNAIKGNLARGRCLFDCLTAFDRGKLFAQ